MYRNIQVLNILCNEAQKNVLMPFVILVGIGMESMGTAALLRISWNYENMFWLMCFGVLAVTAILAILLVLGGMAQTFQESKSILARLQKKNCGVRLKPRKGRLASKWRKRFYWSCTPVKIRVGEINFIDRHTPLNCLNFANGLTVNILLIGV